MAIFSEGKHIGFTHWGKVLKICCSVWLLTPKVPCKTHPSYPRTPHPFLFLHQPYVASKPILTLQGGVKTQQVAIGAAPTAASWSLLTHWLFVAVLLVPHRCTSTLWRQATALGGGGGCVRQGCKSSLCRFRRRRQEGFAGELINKEISQNCKVSFSVFTTVGETWMGFRAKNSFAYIWTGESMKSQVCFHG